MKKALKKKKSGSKKIKADSRVNHLAIVKKHTRDVPIDFDKLRYHAINPLNIREATNSTKRSISGERAYNEVPVDTTTPLLVREDIHHFDRENPFSLQIINRNQLHVAAFGHQLYNFLKDRVAGYAMQIRQHGKVIHSAQYQWARTPNNGAVPWSQNTKMHVASVSKLITSMAMMKLLDDNPDLDVDDPIAPHLPTYWTIGANVGQITFRHLLTHRTGFLDENTNFFIMRESVASGVPTPPTNSGYKNVNYALCRILIAIISGKVDADMYEHIEPSVFGYADHLARDTAWDWFTIGAYSSYVHENIFEPAGVASSFTPAENGALAYDFEGKEYGWDSGEKSTVSATVGWHLSLNELLSVMHTYRRSGEIISPENVEIGLNAYFGINSKIHTPAGYMWYKAGAWVNRECDTCATRKEQCLAYFLPHDMEFAVFINSPVGADDLNIQSEVRDLLLANIKPWNALSVYED